MPLFDFKCTKCESVKTDVLLGPDDVLDCNNCGHPMEKLPSNFSFSMTPGAISKHKKRYGNKVPDNYKTSGGANIYGVPRKP